LLVGIDSVNAHRATFYRAFTAWCVGFLILKHFMHKRSCLVRAGYHAITATNAGVFINQYDAVGTFE